MAMGEYSGQLYDYTDLMVRFSTRIRCGSLTKTPATTEKVHSPQAPADFQFPRNPTEYDSWVRLARPATKTNGAVLKKQRRTKRQPPTNFELVRSPGVILALCQTDERSEKSDTDQTAVRVQSCGWTNQIGR